MLFIDSLREVGHLHSLCTNIYMKLKVCILFFFLASFASVFSQSRLVYVNDFRDDWVLGLSGGVQTFQGTPSSDKGFSHSLSPALSVTLGKWLTPAYGLRIGYNGTYFRDTYGEDVSFFTLHGEFMFNIQNFVNDDMNDHFWCASPYIGTGWAASRGENKNDGWALHFGLQNTFRITSSLQAKAELSAILADKEFDLRIDSGQGFDKLYALTIGLVYRLKFED